jgi:hypothetical protein
MKEPIPINASKGSMPRTRLHGVWSLLARIVWVALALPIVAFVTSSLPQYVAQLKTLCFGVDWDCATGQLTSEQVFALQEYGLSQDVYVAVVITTTATLTLIWFAVAALIVWRRPDDWMALLVALMLMGFGVFITFSPVNPVAPPWDRVVGIMTIAISILALLVFTLFPDGRFVPRWTRWLSLAYISLFALSVIGDSLVGDIDLSWRLAMLLVALLFGSVTAAQIYRYQWISSPAQRTQTKWVVVAVSVAILVFAGQFILLGVLTASPGDPLVRLLISLALAIIALLIPLSFASAVLRHHLFDIDKLMNRTLVYGALTALLAMVYVGGVLTLQSLLHAVTNQTSSIAIVIATLATAALAQPLRQRVQRGIDHRFYRRKYDAEHTLRTFSAVLRSKVDLEDVGAELISVVRQTMQPTHVSLWLSPLRQGGEGEPPPLRQQAQIPPLIPPLVGLLEQGGADKRAVERGGSGLSLRIWGGAASFLAGALWIAHRLYLLVVFPTYMHIVHTTFDSVSITLLSAALLATSAALAALCLSIRRRGRAHWAGTTGFTLAASGAAVAGIGDILEDGFWISSTGELAYGPGLLALLVGLLIAAIMTLITRALPMLYAGTFLMGALTFPLFQVGGDVVFAGGWLALGLYFLTSASNQSNLATLRQTE